MLNVPIALELRAHFLRLMVKFGVRGTAGLGVDAEIPASDDEDVDPQTLCRVRHLNR